jgi:hypothetical protein
MTSTWNYAHLPINNSFLKNEAERPKLTYFHVLLVTVLVETVFMKSKMAAFWVVAPCSLVGYNSEDSHLRTHRRENLKSYCMKFIRNS